MTTLEKAFDAQNHIAVAVALDEVLPFLTEFTQETEIKIGDWVLYLDEQDPGNVGWCLVRKYEGFIELDAIARDATWQALDSAEELLCALRRIGYLFV